VPEQRLVEISASFFVDPHYQAALVKLGLDCFDGVFSFDAARSLTKSNLAPYRSRLQFEIDLPDSHGPTTVFMKRYDRPPVSVQLKNWLSARSRRSCGQCEAGPASELAAAGISTPKTICRGEQWGTLFEKRSFIITEKIADAEAIERKLPECFDSRATTENLKLRRDFITRLAEFIAKFHATKYRHRDLYFSHIFYSDDGRFYLIDLARAFKPLLLRRRFLIKDIAQIYYSAPGRYFSRTDRMRFYFGYTGRRKLTGEDKTFIRQVVKKAQRTARHEIKHGREVPFAN